MKRKVLLQLVVPLLSLCVLFLLLATDPARPRRPAAPTQVSVILREADGSSWPAARQGMEQAAADFGAELRFLTLTQRNDTQEQQLLLERELQNGAAGIVLVPTDRAAMAEAVAQAAAQATVITLETDMTAAGAHAYVGVDNTALGDALGRAALNGVEAGERVLLIASTPGDTGVAQRLAAAAALLEQEGRTVHTCTPIAEQSLETALTAALIASRPQLVLAFEAPALETAARLIQGRRSQPLLYGMGATGAVAAYLEQGDITAIAAQNEFSAGYLAVEAACQPSRRLPPEPLEFSLIRKETMYQPEKQKLLFPVNR